MTILAIENGGEWESARKRGTILYRCWCLDMNDYVICQNMRVTHTCGNSVKELRILFKLDQFY